MLLLEEVAKVKQGSVMLRVDNQRFSVIVFCLLWALSQRAKIVHSTSMLRVQPKKMRRQEERL